jgi:flavodoxin
MLTADSQQLAANGRALDPPSEQAYNPAMKTLIIYSSRHQMNTEKVALAMAREIGATVKKLADAKPEDLDGFDLVGFGTGIEKFDVHTEIKAFVAGLPEKPGRKAFIFCTCASGKDWMARFRDVVAGRGFQIADTFISTGEWAPGLFTLRKGHPDEADLAAARAFARGLVK